ncbi:MAG TPA: L,D-transpeptidase [Pyrinomonadaceae bacterium]|jgi:murein L,D-transpeptidase YafK
MKKILGLILVVLTLASAGCMALRGQTEQPSPSGARTSKREDASVQQASNASTSASERIARTPLKLPLVKPKIIVSKSQRRLDLYEGERLVRTYKIGLGFNPTDDKTREGDGATPEGDFYIFTKNRRSAFHLSLGVSYPNAEDAERGLRDRLISRKQYLQILRAVESKRTPPQYTPLGGLIYIHGGGASRDWTWGCIALENEDMSELFDAVPVGTAIRIEH